MSNVFNGIYFLPRRIGTGEEVTFEISEHDVKDDMDEGDLDCLFEFNAGVHFEYNYQPELCEISQEEFVEWAQSVIQKRKNLDLFED